MVKSRRANQERVNVFEIGPRYIFKHFFDREEIFDRLKPYYNGQRYRFEVPSEEFEETRAFLESHGHELVIVDKVKEFVVVVEQYSSHPENIFKASVDQQSAGGYNYFLMTDQVAVEQAEHEGAVRLTETEFSNPFG